MTILPVTSPDITLFNQSPFFYGLTVVSNNSLGRATLTRINYYVLYLTLQVVHLIMISKCTKLKVR